MLCVTVTLSEILFKRNWLSIPNFTNCFTHWNFNHEVIKWNQSKKQIVICAMVKRQTIKICWKHKTWCSFYKKFIKFCNLDSIILTILLISNIQVSLYVGSRLILYFFKPIRSWSHPTLLMRSCCLYNVFSTNLEFWYLFLDWISYFYTWRSCCFLISWISLGLVWLVSVLKLMWHMLVSHFRDYLPSWTRRLSLIHVSLAQLLALIHCLHKV